MHELIKEAQLELQAEAIVAGIIQKLAATYKLINRRTGELAEITPQMATVPLKSADEFVAQNYVMRGQRAIPLVAEQKLKKSFTSRLVNIGRKIK